MADPRSIHEFTTGQVEATTLLLGDFVDLDAQSGYTTLKMSVSDLGEVLLEDIEYTQDLQTVDKTITGAINENKSVIGYSYDEYDPTTAYAKDDLCIYNNTLYKALQATTGNLPTNTTYWEQTSIADAINELNGEIGISEYNPNRTYNIGEYCHYNGVTYYCNQNSVTGTWDGTKWNSSTVSNDLQNIVVRRTLTETTTANGNVVNHISVVNGIIISARCTSQEAIVTTFLNSLGTDYSFHVVSPTANATVVANTQVTIEYFMIPRRRIINAKERSET